MRNPIEFYFADGWRITSPFGWRTHPISGERHHHNGTDLGGKPEGHPVKTPFAGKVIAARYFPGFGRTVAICITDNINQITAHHQSLECAPGDRVEAGETIATNGATGEATGPHIHYELRYADGGTIGRTVWGNPEEFYLEVEELQEEAISYHGVSDLRAAHILHIITEAPIYFETTIRGKKIAKKLYVVGGSKRKLTGEEAEEFVDYSGKDGTETLDNVLKKRK